MRATCTPPWPPRSGKVTPLPTSTFSVLDHRSCCSLPRHILGQSYANLSPSRSDIHPTDLSLPVRNPYKHEMPSPRKPFSPTSLFSPEPLPATYIHFPSLGLYFAVIFRHDHHVCSPRGKATRGFYLGFRHRYSSPSILFILTPIIDFYPPVISVIPD